MLVLCSDGLTSENVLQALHTIVSINRQYKSAALVVTASQLKAKSHNVKRCISELRSLDLTIVDIVDLDCFPAERLLNYDVVYFIGGDPIYLVKSIRNHHAEDILKVIADTKLLIGFSAAAVVFGPTLSLLELLVPSSMKQDDLNGLHLTSINVLPHFDELSYRISVLEKVVDDFEKEYSEKIIRLNDGDAVMIDQEKSWILRGN